MDRLERAVQERTAALAHEVAERRRAEKIQHALYEIANLSAQAPTPTSLQRQPARHHQRADDGQEFPDRAVPPGHARRSASRISSTRRTAQAPRQALPFGTAMCSYILSTQAGAAARRGQLQGAGCRRRVAEPLGNSDIASWMGAPMLLGDQPYGVIVVQSYDPADRLRQGRPRPAGLHGQPRGRGDGAHAGRPQDPQDQGSARSSRTRR